MENLISSMVGKIITNKKNPFSFSFIGDSHKEFTLHLMASNYFST